MEKIIEYFDSLKFYKLTCFCVILTTFLYGIHFPRSNDYYLIVNSMIAIFAACSFFLSGIRNFNKELAFIYFLIIVLMILTYLNYKGKDYSGIHMLTLLLLIKPFIGIKINDLFGFILTFIVIFFLCDPNINWYSRNEEDINYLLKFGDHFTHRLKTSFLGYGEFAIICILILFLSRNFHNHIYKEIVYFIFIIVLVLTGSRSVIIGYVFTIFLFEVFKKNSSKIEFISSILLTLLLINSFFATDGLLSLSHRYKIVQESFNTFQQVNIGDEKTELTHQIHQIHQAIYHNWFIDYYDRTVTGLVWFLVIIFIVLYLKINYFQKNKFIDYNVQKIWLTILLASGMDFLLIPTKPCITTLFFIYFSFYEFSHNTRQKWLK